ncbi:MAG: hypothetical protein HFF11_03115 [Angelakisella sp.]|jgi:hypothetical protein|nr:hypothetical protein [Angelakisella sp.]
MRKSRLFSLLCACWPGAGEMYLGLMNRGVAIMLLFWGVVVIGATGFPPPMFILPVLWFYSFFDTLTLRNLDYYALTELQERDEYFFEDLMGGKYSLPEVVEKYRLLIGLGLILAGGYTLYEKVVRFLWRSDILPGWLYSLLDNLPNMLLSFGIIALGIWLVRGKRMPADEVEDFPQYGKRLEGTREEKGNDKRSA